MAEQQIFCRVCLTPPDQLNENRVELYRDRVCDCRGTVGAICHTCLERLVLTYGESHCMHCMKNYANIELVYKRDVIDAFNQLCDKLFKLYLIFRGAFYVAIIFLCNMRFAFLLAFTLTHYDLNGNYSPEVVGIRVTTRQRLWSKIWAAIRRAFTS